MRALVLPVLLVTWFAGCEGETNGDEPAGARGELRSKLEALADAGCACKDTRCAGAVRKAVQALANSTRQVADEDFAPLQPAQARLDECLAVLNPAVIEYRSLTAQVCACRDAACAKQVGTAFATWAAALKSTKQTLPPSDAHLLVSSGTRAAACLQKFDLPIPQ